ncbi:hypothetical protein HOY34_00290 [Xinfangfangia sp. D13-10-4-6]|uniref:hypothetical protein n=1 Tax=Pseudogemmobacter hezensis TaxID=2737662 RepID=UPI0015561C68|nr:hypothetical protein [Pseudogemmobacter hezensis]NPD13638.1 hypothetical protein [Pseudogemmobacter hezensis]
MPLTSFLGLIAFVICAAGLTILFAFSLGVPMSLVAFVALAGSLFLGLRQWR